MRKTATDGEASSGLSTAGVIAALPHLFAWISAWWLAEASRPSAHSQLAWLFGNGRKRLAITRAGPDNVELKILALNGQVLHQDRVSGIEFSEGATGAFLKRAGYDATFLPIGIVMPQEAVFERSIEMPREAASGFRNVAKEEMVRRTPFRPDQVFMQMTVTEHPSDRSRRLVRQRIVRRDLVAEQCRMLGVDQDRVRFLATPATLSAADSIDLAGDSPNTTGIWLRVLIMLALTGLVLAVIDFGVIWWKRETALVQIERQISEVRSRALSVRGMINEIAERQALIRSMFDRKSLSAVLEAWEETSRLLPDSSWLTEFSVADGWLQIAGYSDNAAALVPLFGESKLLTDIALSSPITMQGGTSVERFSIDARFAGPVAELEAGQ